MVMSKRLHRPHNSQDLSNCSWVVLLHPFIGRTLLSVIGILRTVNRSLWIAKRINLVFCCRLLSCSASRIVPCKCSVYHFLCTHVVNCDLRLYSWAFSLLFVCVCVVDRSAKDEDNEIFLCVHQSIFRSTYQLTLAKFSSYFLLSTEKINNVNRSLLFVPSLYSCEVYCSLFS